LNNLTEDFIRDIDQYLEEAFMEETNKTKIPQLRAIPIEQAVDVERNIATYDDIRAIIENSGDPIVVNKCICRKKNDILGNSCKTTDLRETCFSFRAFALSYQNMGLGRKVSKEEALEILEEAEKAGLVLQPGNSLRPMGVCCCCGCCCQIIENQKKFDAPAQFFASNYSTQVDSERCKGCGTCKTRCPMDAIEIVEGKSKKDLGRCIGCGACVPTCPENAIELIEKGSKFIPPKNTFETYKSIAIERARLEKLESD
jgi:ferredoxin